MLAKIIHSHLDEIDAIDAKAQSRIDQIIAAIDIKELLADPRQALGDAVDEVKKAIIEEFQPLAEKNGQQLVAEMKKHDVMVDPSKDPTKNEDIVK